LAYADPYDTSLPPTRLAALYRQLRKAQEDAKNEPGAADFYYGEMEMRRLARQTPLAERLILTLYWMVAGYGLRASRALLTFALVVGTTAWLLWQGGFTGPRPEPGEVGAYALLSALSVEGGTSELTEHLSLLGDFCRALLRVLSPVLIGLALLSIRNRVKR
jgi:hypothetical protein